MTELNVKESAIDFPNYKLVLIRNLKDNIVGKMIVLGSGELDDTHLTDAYLMNEQLVPVEDKQGQGFANIFIMIKLGTVIYIPETAAIIALDTESSFYREYTRVTSSIEVSGSLPSTPPPGTTPFRRNRR